MGRLVSNFQTTIIYRYKKILLQSGQIMSETQLRKTYSHQILKMIQQEIINRQKIFSKKLCRKICGKISLKYGRLVSKNLQNEDFSREGQKQNVI